MEKICWQITVAAFMQPLQYDLRSPAAKDNSIPNAATARSNLDAAITMRFAETELQNTIVRTTRNGVGNCSSKTGGSRCQSEKKTILKHFLKGFLEGKSLAPKWRKSADKSLWQPSCSHSNTIYEVQLQKTIVLRMQPQHEATLTQPFTLRERSYSCKSQWNSIGNSSTSNTCNPIYIAGTILQLQITMEFCRPHMHEKHLKPHLQCGTDPTMVREWSENDPTTHEIVSHPSHRRGRSSTFGDALCPEKRRFSCICYLSKTHFVRDFLQNSIGNSSTSTTCNPIYIAGTILQLQITMEFCRPHMHEKHLKPHLQCGTDPTMVRDRSEHDPTTHETVSHPSHRRGRSSTFGDALCPEKHTVSCICYISQKRISCETSFKTPSATPLAPLAIPFKLRERSYSCKSQWNSVDRTCTKNTWNPIYNAEPIRPWSETDPSMIRPHTRPSRTRRTAEVDHRRSGTHFVRKKRTVSCICYLSKTHFVRDFLQNSIGNSSTSTTTCNPIYNEGTILELQITMEFHRQLIHQHHLQSHLHCGNDPTVANHNGILSTANARNTGDTPFTMRNRSETDPSMIRPHTRPSRTRRTAEVDHRRSGTHMSGKTQGFVHLLSLKNAFRARLPSKLHRQLLHQHHLQSHLQWGNNFFANSFCD